MGERRETALTMSSEGVELLRRIRIGLDEESKAVDWSQSADHLYAAEGNLIRGLLVQHKNPEQTIDFFEEARFHFVSVDGYDLASQASKAIALVYERDLQEFTKAEEYRALAEYYSQSAAAHPQLVQEFLDD